MLVGVLGNGLGNTGVEVSGAPVLELGVCPANTAPSQVMMGVNLSTARTLMTVLRGNLLTRRIGLSVK